MIHQNQVNKITQRQQKIGIYGNQHVPMNREQIATTDTFNIPVKQDSLNPNLKNTISRFVNLDSQFRQYTNGSSSTSTEYTLDLSDTLKDALSLSVYSYQLGAFLHCEQNHLVLYYQDKLLNNNYFQQYHKYLLYFLLLYAI